MIDRFAVLQRWRQFLFALLIVIAMLKPHSDVFSQTPCPGEFSQQSEQSIESAVKGTLRYHEWSIEVLEEVTTSVSSRLKEPDGSDEKSLSVSFDVVGGGAIDALTIAESSGDPSFDDEFLQAILFLAPFSIDNEFMSECSIASLALSIKWENGGSFTEIREQLP